MQLRGSKSLNFLPSANQTNITIRGDWSDPSFNGAFLPEERDTESNPFMANWSVPNFSRKLPQQWQGTTQGRLYTFSGANLIDGDSGYYPYGSAGTASENVDHFERSNDSDMIQIHFLPKVNEYQKITLLRNMGC